MIDIQLTGLAKNIARFKGKGPRVTEAIKQVLEEEVAREVQYDIQSQTPINTGNAYNSVKINVRFGNDVSTLVEVYADLDQAPYWEFIEEGAAPHVITPNSADVLHFTAGGDEVFAKAVNHPGMQAMYIFRDQKELWKDKIDSYSDKIMSKIKELFA